MKIRLALISLAFAFSLSGCKQDVWSQRFYFPNGSLPEDNWTVVGIISIQSQPNHRVGDQGEKTYAISINNKKGDNLYFESGKMTFGDFEATGQWQTTNSLKLFLKSENSKVLLERDLEYDSTKNIYTVKK